MRLSALLFSLPLGVLAPALLVGCTSSKAVDDTAADDTAIDDSSGDSDSAIDDTAVTPPDFSFSLSGDWEGTALTLTWLDFTGMMGGDLTLGRVAYAVPVEQEKSVWQLLLPQGASFSTLHFRI